MFVTVPFARVKGPEARFVILPTLAVPNAEAAGSPTTTAVPVVPAARLVGVTVYWNVDEVVAVTVQAVQAYPAGVVPVGTTVTKEFKSGARWLVAVTVVPDSLNAVTGLVPVGNRNWNCVEEEDVTGKLPL